MGETAAAVGGGRDTVQTGSVWQRAGCGEWAGVAAEVQVGGVWSGDMERGLATRCGGGDDATDSDSH